MRISLAYCDLCKMKVDTFKMTKLNLVVPDDAPGSTANNEFSGEICYNCSTSIVKKLSTPPQITVEAKKEPVYRTAHKPGEPIETPYMGAMGNH